MRFQDVTSHPLAIRLGLSIARHTPHWLGYGIARFAASLVACAKPRIYWTVRANLRQALGPETDRRTLHRLSREVFFHAGKTYYDHFHAFTHGDDTVRAMIHMTAEDLANLKEAQSSGRGVMLATGHLSAFDLAGLVLALYGIKLQGLSLRDPIDGFKLLNLMRIQGGIQATPVQVTSLREAIRRLRQGGLVGTGVDRPIGHGDEPVEFFGKTALLPTGHIRLALRTNAIVVVGYCEHDPDTGYRLRVEPPMELVRTGNRDEDVRVNARRVLEALERAILAHPEQWLLFVPVWPDELQASTA